MQTSSSKKLIHSQFYIIDTVKRLTLKDEPSPRGPGGNAADF